MNKKEAIEYCVKEFGVGEESFESGVCAVFSLRHEAILLPEMGIDGSMRDESSWAFYDSGEKIDTRKYGAIYYF